MSNDNTTNTTAPAATDMSAIKSELDTKLAAVNDQLKSLNDNFARQLNEMSSAILSTRQPQREQSAPEKLDPYADDYADKLAAKISIAATRAASEASEAANNAALSRQTAINALAMEYPEMAQNNSEFAKKVVQIHQTLDKNTQGTAFGYRYAAREAAAELGILPISKRQKQDEFVMGGSKSTGKAAKSEVEGIDDKTLETAQLMGLDISNKKVLERLKQGQEKFSKVNISKYE